MKYLNWETGNLPRHAKMSHKLRSMIKMRDRNHRAAAIQKKEAHDER